MRTTESGKSTSEAVKRYLLKNSEKPIHELIAGLSAAQIDGVKRVTVVTRPEPCIVIASYVDTDGEVQTDPVDTRELLAQESHAAS